MTFRSSGSEIPGFTSRATIAPVLAALATALLAVLLFAGPTLADPLLPDVSPHRHFIQTPNGPVPVGPQICGNPKMQHAFNQFHFNVHRSALFTGPVVTLGPQFGAPGLHNDHGADITITAC